MSLKTSRRKIISNKCCFCLSHGIKLPAKREAGSSTWLPQSSQLDSAGCFDHPIWWCCLCLLFFILFLGSLTRGDINSQCRVPTKGFPHLISAGYSEDSIWRCSAAYTYLLIYLSILPFLPPSLPTYLPIPNYHLSIYLFTLASCILNKFTQNQKIWLSEVSLQAVQNRCWVLQLFGPKANEHKRMNSKTLLDAFMCISKSLERKADR